MKNKRFFIAALFLSGLSGWVLGFLRLPYIEEQYNFLIGFLSCLLLLGIVSLFGSIWQKNTRILDWLNANKDQNTTKPLKTYTLLWILVLVFLLAGTAVSAFLIYQQQNFFKKQLAQQNALISQQADLLASSRKSNGLFLINNLSRQIEEELDSSPERKLSESTIEKIAALNYALQPYAYWEADSLTKRKLSPERGQLLLLLARTAMDSSSFTQLKAKMSFSHVDLPGADLSNINLSGIDLSEANLKEANLNNTNLNGANLKNSTLWGAKLRSSQLKNADLEKTELSWADFSDANLKNARLTGVKLTSTKLSKADLSKANITYSSAKSSFFNEAIMIGTKLTGTNLEGANMSKAILKDANLRISDLRHIIWKEATIEEVDFTGSIVLEENWPDYLRQQQVKGTEKLKETFETTPDAKGIYPFFIQRK